MHEKARRVFLHEESHSLSVSFGFWCVFGLPDAYVTSALEKEKATLPSLLLNTARRFSIEIEMWFVNQWQKKKSRISSQSGRYIYFKVSFLSTNLKTLSKKIALITSHLSFILRFDWIVVLWFRNFTWLWAWRHQVTCTGIPKHVSWWGSWQRKRGRQKCW